MKSIWVLLGVALVLPDEGDAQAPPRPHWSIAVSLGEGPHTARAGDVYYRTSSSNSGELSAAYRFGAGALRPMLQAELLTEGPGSDMSGCPVAPNGSCRRVFPAPDGVGVATGIAYEPMTRVETSLLAGVGRYDATRRTFLEAEAAFGVTARIAVAVAIRRMTWNEPQTGRHWYRPLHVGMRAQW